MGFYSWDCKKCGHPMLSGYAVDKVNRWMNQVVVITRRGRLLMGGYDGYGRVDGVEIPTNNFNWDKGTGHPDCYHLACWRKAGEPKKYTGGSEMSADQGYFFDPGTHTMEEPK